MEHTIKCMLILTKHQAVLMLVAITVQRPTIPVTITGAQLVMLTLTPDNTALNPEIITTTTTYQVVTITTTTTPALKTITTSTKTKKRPRALFLFD